MSYLDRLKRLDSGEIFQCAPETAPTKPTEPPFDGFVGCFPGANENTQCDTTDTKHAWWWLHFENREPMQVCINPAQTHAEVLTANPEALAAIPGQLSTTKPHWYTSPDDDRRTCNQCANLIARRCLAAKRGEIVASRDYEPVRDIHRRCEGYTPGADDPDKRHGRVRWPGLIQKGGE